MKETVMVVEDVAEVRHFVSHILDSEGYYPLVAADAAELKQALTGPQPDIVLLDLGLPDGDGLDLLPLIKKQWPTTQVIVLTGNATFDAAIEATKRGAYHFQTKPFDTKNLLISIERAAEYKRLTEETGALRKALSTMSGDDSPVFQSAAMKAVVRTVERVASSNVPVLITGESGTGKEVIADLIHALSSCSKGPLVKINCAALPRDLIESELFGSIEGVSPGSKEHREGLFRRCEGGSLLLDEICEMPVDTQSKLLRVIQEKEVHPIGGRTSYKTDCRIIALTNRKPEEAIKEGKLREDLFYRISTVTLHLPPLRERREDILPLAATFLRRYAAQEGRTIEGFSPAAKEKLRLYDWPGNVRQLQNEVQRTVLISENQLIGEFDLSFSVGANSESDVEELTLLEAIERNTIARVLKETGGNKVETAKRLGIGRQTLYNKIKIYNIEAS